MEIPRDRLSRPLERAFVHLHARDVVTFISGPNVYQGWRGGWKGVMGARRQIRELPFPPPFSRAPKVGINFFDATCATVAAWNYFVGTTQGERGGLRGEIRGAPGFTRKNYGVKCERMRDRE